MGNFWENMSNISFYVSVVAAIDLALVDFDPTKILLKISPWEYLLKFGLEFILLRFTQLFEIPRLPRQNPGQLGLAPDDTLCAGVDNRVGRVVCVEDVIVAVDGLKDRELNTKMHPH